MKRKYLITVGYGSISAQQLMNLYGVQASECVVIDSRRPHTRMGYDKEFLNSLIKLPVRTDGNYTLPT